MKLAIASGKGGTGKTTVAVSLALSLASAAAPPLFLDCDVEEPNAALFLRPEITAQRDVGLLIPVVDMARCTACGRCAEVCEYHAITVINKQVLVFPELCHGCGSCSHQCPEGAIHETLNACKISVHCVDPMACELRAAHGSGNAFANDCAYGDVTGLTHDNCDTRVHARCNTNASTDCDHCAAHGDAERDVHGDTCTTTNGGRNNAHNYRFV